MGELDEALERGVGRQRAEEPLGVAAVPGHRAFAQEPAFGAGADATVGRAMAWAAGGPPRPDCGHRLAQFALGTLPPRHGLPGRLGQDREHRFGGAPRGRPRLLRLLTTPLGGDGERQTMSRSGAGAHLRTFCQLL